MRRLPLTFSRLACTLVLGAGGMLGSTCPALELLPANSPVQATLSGSLDLETYFSDTPQPGLLFSDDEAFLQPRLRLMLDLARGSHWSGFVQARADRGFDPGLKEDGDVRLDEYGVRWKPFEDPILQVQAGKFATVFGNWVSRHLSSENPFITAPAPYENVLGMTDATAPPTRAAFLGRKVQADKKKEWVTQIWGPSYAHGASVFGIVDKFDYAFELKSHALSSRPSSWDASEVEWDHPTWTGRLGYRPSVAWVLGISASTGTYLLDSADATLPSGTDRGNFEQDTLGLDLSYAHRHFELWSELILTRFEVPNVGDAEMVSFYVEGRYKLTASLYLALRWNQQWFGDVADGRGGNTPWDRDLYRADLALGYKFTRNLNAKVQYSYGHEGGNSANAEHLLATKLSWEF
ncbi:MAG: hypothetical protein ACAI34_14830 [Verrucomicrobium sp.]|nr:hypothetical protein [Verrucomicrobium sp.]